VRQVHIEIYAQYKGSIHGGALAKGIQEAPSCPQCHGEHRIYAHKDAMSSVYATKVSEQCSKCHASVAIMGKFNIEVEQVATYKESSHGVASQFGSATWRTAPRATAYTTSARTKTPYRR